jgi:hypothetical protein
MKNLKVNLLLFVGCAALLTSVYEYLLPLYHLWQDPRFAAIRLIWDFFETFIIVLLIVAWLQERSSRKLDNLNRIEAEKAVENRLENVINGKIKNSISQLLEDKIKPINSTLLIIQGRIDKLYESKR